MIETPLIDELYEIRRRLAEQCGYDFKKYAEMLRETSRRYPAARSVSKPLLPDSGIDCSWAIYDPSSKKSVDECAANPAVIGSPVTSTTGKPS